MGSGITLSAGVRQNLLSLQNTADLMATTQSRLATGKKVNSALDNPSNFFTSQSLSDRASDLNALLDSIGQATKTLDAANNGITSLTKLVQSAKSAAQQARQATSAVSTYAAVNANSDISAAANLNGDETIATVTGNTGVTGEMAAQAISLDFTTLTEQRGQLNGAGAFGAAAGGGDAGNLVIDIGGADFTVALANGNDLDAFVTTFNNTAGLGAAGAITASNNAGVLRLTANNADVDFTVDATSDAVTLTKLQLTSGTVTNSTSLLDRVVAGGGASGTSTLVLDVNGGAGGGGVTKTITFGTGGGQISTFAELNTELTVNGIGGGASGSITGGAFAGNPPVNAPHLVLSHAQGATNTLKLTVADAGVRTALGMGGARGVGQGGGMDTALSRTYNSAATLEDTDPANLASGGNFTITVNGSAQTVGLAASDRLSDILTKLRANATLNNNLTFEDSGGNLKMTAKTADVDFQVAAGAVTTGLGVSTAAQNSTSLLDRLNTKLGGTAGQGATLTLAVNGGSTQTITFGTGDGQVSTKAELATALGNLSGLTAGLTGTSLNLQVASGSSATSLNIGGSAASALGLTAGTSSGAVTSTTANATRSSLQNDFNNVLDQIDALAKDASYNGINLLNGDNLKVVFNENGSSSLTISGVTFKSNNLGLNKASGDNFQDNAKIDTTISAIDSALTTLRTQASKFGSNLTTVQTRQDFTKNMVNTLQTGADNLVLADTNEEGANMLALQTRQQLSTTALSLANQANQAVLRMF